MATILSCMNKSDATRNPNVELELRGKRKNRSSPTGMHSQQVYRPTNARQAGHCLITLLSYLSEWHISLLQYQEMKFYLYLIVLINCYYYCELYVLKDLKHFHLLPLNSDLCSCEIVLSCHLAKTKQ